MRVASIFDDARRKAQAAHASLQSRERNLQEASKHLNNLMSRGETGSLVALEAQLAQRDRELAALTKDLDAYRTRDAFRAEAQAQSNAKKKTGGGRV